MPALVHAKFGGVPGRTCAGMYLQMQLQLERLLVGEVPDPTELLNRLSARMGTLRIFLEVL